MLIVTAAAAVAFGIAGGAALSFFTKPVKAPEKIVQTVPKPVATPVLESPKRRVWCSIDPQHDDLQVYLENESTPALGFELGKAHLVPAKSQLDGESPLAVQCLDNILWWVNAKSVFKVELTPNHDECCTLRVLQKTQYTVAQSVPEYLPPETRILAADVFVPTDGSLPSVATISNTGWFLVFRPPTDAVLKDRFLFNLSDNDAVDPGKLMPTYVTRAAVAILDPNHFSVVPFGDKDHPIIRAYRIFKLGTSYLDPRKPTVIPMNFANEDKAFLTLTGFFRLNDDDPFAVFRPDRGGLVTILSGLKKDGRTVHTDIIIAKPDQPEQK